MNYFLVLDKFIKCLGMTYKLNYKVCNTRTKNE